jgi:UDP-N-acetylmuramoyl-L-alanyl-D-glutamate--2,6-diaminopimelate ligase
MKLRQMIGPITGARLSDAGLLDRDVAGLAFDSRKVAPGYLFFAIPGKKADGRNFASQAIEKGALAVVSEGEPPAGFLGPWIYVPHTRRALALMAREFHPRAKAMHAIGITGTNGKTTTSILVEQILRAAGLLVVLIGTIEYRLPGKTLPALNTTPESLDIYEMLDEGAGAGATHAVLEASSHALAQERIAGLAFHTAVWTNLTRDHLDFHESMQAYFEAKQRLFVPAAGDPPQVAVLNATDSWAKKLRLDARTRPVWYAVEEAADIRATRVESGLRGSQFDLEYEGRRYAVKLPLPGRVNVSNALAAFGAASAAGLSAEQIVEALASCPPVPGRFETVDAGQPFAVVVDYAHTDDALRNTLSMARSLTATRVITVFGCGGDRDRDKRPLMGRAAGELSAYAVVTSDNPRSEDPLMIINDILVGLRRTDVAHAVEPDRERAIRRALSEAGPGDVVVIAGKGHEPYQVLKERTVDFDDRLVARRLLEEFGYRKEGA